MARDRLQYKAGRLDIALALQAETSEESKYGQGGRNGREGVAP